MGEKVGSKRFRTWQDLITLMKKFGRYYYKGMRSGDVDEDVSRGKTMGENEKEASKGTYMEAQGSKKGIQKRQSKERNGDGNKKGITGNENQNR